MLAQSRSLHSRFFVIKNFVACVNKPIISNKNFWEAEIVKKENSLTEADLWQINYTNSKNVLKLCIPRWS